MKTNILLLLLIASSFAGCSGFFNDNTYSGVSHHFTSSSNGVPVKQVYCIDFVSPSIVRIRFAEGDSLINNIGDCVLDNNTGVCLPRDNKSYPFRCSEADQFDTYSTDELVVTFNKVSHSFTFTDPINNKVLFTTGDSPMSANKVAKVNVVYDEASAHVEHTANGDVTVKDEVSRDTIGFTTQYRVNLKFKADEAIYGLGAHMEDYMNLRGKTLYLTQHNLKAMVPVLNSTAGYGLLFDAGCAMKFVDNADESYMHLDAANVVDLYFMKGEKLGDVVAQYRSLTGSCPMMPRYMFGYIQSKERYVSQDDLLSTLAEYRRRQVPIDMIVQDWSYWPEGWGYMKMDPKFYPDPKAMADSVHAMNAKLMVSIWPNPQYCPQERDFRERGFMLEQSVYDVFNPAARDYYWSYANNEFFSKGFDAWWCDCSEPLDGDWKPMGDGYGWDNQEERWHHNKNTLSISLGEERSSLYSLYHAMGIYENQRKASSDKRVVNLTRSSYAGQQRYATITWNGDTHASWTSFKQQIPAGLNFMATGCPYWSVDIGSFFTRGNDRWNRWFYMGQFPDGCSDPAYREYYTRMFQWGTFLPMMRSHGTDTPREIWRFGEPGEPFYDAILFMINLRYRMLPYIYSNAWRITNDNYTMARLLAFDFADDSNVFDIKDEYMFGDAFLVCPVTDPGVSSRKVYLPKGASWYDYWTGAKFEGGQTIDAPSPISQLPLYVKAGSIVPMGQVVEYSSAQVGKPVDIYVYPGSDATFSLYDDEGDNYNCEKGAYAVVNLKWNDKDSSLTIGKRNGQYDGMPQNITFNVITPSITKSVEYNGSEVVINL